MAYLQARAGIARSGVTYAGWSPTNLEFRVNNTVRSWMFRDFAITEALDSSPGTFTFTVDPAEFTPSVGQSVSFKWTTPNRYWFAGTILRRGYMLDKDGGRLWRCEAVDNTWLLDRYARVSGEYFSRGFNTIVATIVADFTDGGFTVGYCPSSLGNIDHIALIFEPDRMAKHSRSERRRRPATPNALFSSSWPWQALYPFCDELLATVYPKSLDLWQELRSTCTAICRSLEHHDYEGDIQRDEALSAVVGVIREWPNAEVKFRQAQTLLGRNAWNSMAARAVDKCGKKLR